MTSVSCLIRCNSKGKILHRGTRFVMRICRNYSAFASQKNAKHPLVSRLNVHPPAQSSARGVVSSGQVSPALLRRSKLTLFICVNTTTRRMNASVKNKMKFHDDSSNFFCGLIDTVRRVFFAIGNSFVQVFAFLCETLHSAYGVFHVLSI